jgi:transposase
MQATNLTSTTQSIFSDQAAIFVSLELSRAVWLVTALVPGGSQKMSRHQVPGGDLAGLLGRFAELQRKAHARTGQLAPIVVIQEAGLDGFWIHRVLESEGIESHVVDPASIAVSRRHRRAKTDRIDGEALVRTLLAYKRGEPRVCAMVRVPTPDEEDQRRLCRELKTLVGERVRHVNRLRGCSSRKALPTTIHGVRTDGQDSTSCAQAMAVPCRPISKLWRGANSRSSSCWIGRSRP